MPPAPSWERASLIPRKLVSIMLSDAWPCKLLPVILRARKHVLQSKPRKIGSFRMCSAFVSLSERGSRTILKLSGGGMQDHIRILLVLISLLELATRKPAKQTARTVLFGFIFLNIFVQGIRRDTFR